MTLIYLNQLAAWPDDTASEGAHARHRLLAIVAGHLGIVEPYGAATPTHWRLAAITTNDLPALRDAVAAEGQRTDRQPVPLPGGHRFQDVRRHPTRTVNQLLARIDRHTPGDPTDG